MGGVIITTIVTLAVGFLCIGIGIANRRGNISMLHSYHIHRVKEEDKLPLGKKMGIGMIILGGGIVVSSVFSFVAVLTENEVFEHIGMGIMGVGIGVGLVISLKAIKKYNKGIF